MLFGTYILNIIIHHTHTGTNEGIIIIQAQVLRYQLVKLKHILCCE